VLKDVAGNSISTIWRQSRTGTWIISEITPRGLQITIKNFGIAVSRKL